MIESRRLVDIDLAADRATWHVPGDDHARVTFWWRDVPLGHALLDRTEVPLASAQVAELAAARCALAVGRWIVPGGFDIDAATFCRVNDAPVGSPARWEMLPAPGEVAARLDAALILPPANPGSPGLSVIICTRQRAESLARCLRSLAASRAPAEEVIVVDNAPRDDVTRTAVAAFPGVRYVLESVPGLSHARNAGVKAATQSIVAFTDDDVEVTPEWTARVRQVMTTERCDAMTGAVLPARLDTEAQVAFEESAGGFARGYRPLVFDAAFLAATRRTGPPVWRIGAGANMAFRREALERAGPFDPRLGAGATGCSEDSELWYRLLAGGGVIRYDPRAVVRHHHRETRAELVGQMRAYMKGHVAALFVQWKRHAHRGNLRRLVVNLPAHFLMREVWRFVLRAGPRHWTWNAELRGMTAGALWGLARLLRRESRR